MFKFNNTHIITGYIKQLLHDFNLPFYRVYTLEHAKYFAEHGEESPEIIGTITREKSKENAAITSSYYINYIKNNELQKYVDGKWTISNTYHYHYNKKELNQTRNLKITNNVYDSYTHEYLGNYLRFIRDYHNIDLMPLYNCFSNVICTDLKLHKYGFEFDSSDVKYKIYMLPVKLFKKYTIAIDSKQPIEIVCSFYSKYLMNNAEADFICRHTYKKYAQAQFNMPITYDGLMYNALNRIDDELLDTTKISLANHESELKMFIKIPADNNSTITILEGDYSKYNDCLFDTSSGKLYHNVYITNHATSNYAEGSRTIDGHYIGTGKSGPTVIDMLPDLSERPFTPITKLQLLSANSGTSYPFADRLIEYLLGNVISDIDSINDNISRAQNVMKRSGYKFAFDGLWDNKMRILAYDYMNTTHPKATVLSSEINHDILGYIDKDVERYYTCWTLVKQLDRDGKPIPTGEYIKTEELLAESSSSLLGEANKGQILSSAGDSTQEPIYKEEWVPAATIANVDIYDSLYDMEDK